MANPHNIVVGQELWFVPTRYGNEKIERTLTVTKVGRVWAEVTGGYVGWRFDLETLQIDGKDYTSPGTVYLDRAVWDLKKKRSQLWSAIRNHVSNNNTVPSHVTVENLEEFLRLIENKT